MDNQAGRGLGFVRCFSSSHLSSHTSTVRWRGDEEALRKTGTAALPGQGWSGGSPSGRRAGGRAGGLRRSREAGGSPIWGATCMYMLECWS